MVDQNSSSGLKYRYEKILLLLEKGICILNKLRTDFGSEVLLFKLCSINHYSS